MQAKISDFGLSTVTAEGKDYYQASQGKIFHITNWIRFANWTIGSLTLWITKEIYIEMVI